MSIDIDKVTNIVVGDVYANDYPDFSDAYFESAVWKLTGNELTEEELDELTSQYPGVVNEMAYESLLD